MPVTHGVAGSSPVHSAEIVSKLLKTSKLNGLDVFFWLKITQNYSSLIPRRGALLGRSISITNLATELLTTDFQMVEILLWAQNYSKLRKILAYLKPWIRGIIKPAQNTSKECPRVLVILEIEPIFGKKVPSSVTP